jgi:GAF domain-containing protein
LESYRQALLQLRALVETQGVRAGLAYLTSLTGHRFTALYRFDRETLHNVVFFDRENPAVTTAESIPVLASYCVFVRDSDACFHTRHAAIDDRVGDHPKRHVLQAYCGVPLRDGFGNLLGTLCHFDFHPTGITRDNLELMEAVAPMLQRAAA